MENKEVLTGTNLINSYLPDLELEIYHQEKIKKIKLSDYRGKWLILFFYPADFTFVCPTELKEMAENYDNLKKLGAEVISVSTDNVYSHKAWHDTSETIKHIAFPMASDQTARLSQSLGVYIEEKGEALRGTFIINPQGVIKVIEVNDNSIGRSAQELVRKLQAAIFVSKHGDQVCPASWQPGGSTLKPDLDLVGKI
ncbi:redoxin domain-containing protein [Candidatus Falkowbacteria bacterium]|uniref:Peroxiredoxin n=1 Tax=Candidatus Buchananbacteria bacterium CG10_big_fil_rev_8_21_14_0_10_33_19 TaxID=1974525 RepID=A0A2H0W549_9BACT|nr:redoxin domain-containing protein [Candidatus Falkowbacteria bacterium]PIS06407.1 MAG: peroxiredoxin [Candidatus Buchananbacteria bacterium CG10_big_fil_rev_8_21_14_0_10_33_19]